jgi:UDP-3-O-[3-hydroxymyristoyl] glucosamine N-acyltransferase
MKKNSILLTCEEIGKISDGICRGEKDTVVSNLNGIAQAQPGELTFISSPKYMKHLKSTKASAVIVPDDIVLPKNGDTCYITCKNPYEGFLKVVKHIDDIRKTVKTGHAESANIASSAQIDDTAVISPNVTIGENCKIGKGTFLKPGVVLYDNVEIGEHVLIHSNVVVYDNSEIGNNVIIHAGAVIGSDGFGNIENPDGSWIKIPHIGNAILEDDVEIGANTTIDRAFVGSTIIRKGAKIDNLVQIGHNCDVGEHTAFAGQVGLAGSTIIGKRNRFGGQVGAAGHIETADDVTVLAQSGIAQSISEKGAYLGSPISQRLEQIRIYTAIKKLPELVKKIAKLEKEIEKKK